MPLLSNTDTNVHVSLLSGKVAKTGARKSLSPQKKMTCTLYALRRISIFATADKNNTLLQAYKKIKKVLAEYDGDFDKLVEVMKEVLAANNISLANAILTNKIFMNKCRLLKIPDGCEIKLFECMDSFEQWLVLYDTFIDKILQPLLNVENAQWHPADGFKGLADCLRKQGAVFFMGKFGAWAYQEPPVKDKNESTEDRTVFYFKAKSYRGDRAPLSFFRHGIIVDQVKIVDGREMVFFRDPGHSSFPLKKEVIFMLSYETFIKRLTDRQGYPLTVDKNLVPVGLASRFPERLKISEEEAALPKIC